MKKKNFKVKKFDESKKAHEVKHDDLITQYDRMRSIANAIYNSDFFAMATKKEQKEIEASVACISKTLVSMIGLDAIDHAGYHPDDSGDVDRSRSDNLPDDSVKYADINKRRHDAIKKIMNIAYGKTVTNGVEKAATRQILNSVYGVPGSMKADTDHAPSSIVAMNREILGGLGSKSSMRISPMQTLVEVPSDDDSDTDEVKDSSEINLGNFADGSFDSDQYGFICQIYGFDVTETLKQIEKVASQYHIQMINLVDIVDDRYQIKPDGKYELKPGNIFFVINKKNCKNPFFLLIYTKPFIESSDFDIDLVSTEIIPVKKEESTKTKDIELINPDFYFNIGKPNSDNVIDLNASLDRIKDAARNHDINSITFTGMIWDGPDIYDDRYSLKPGSLFYFNGGPHLTDFLLVTEVGDTPDATRVLFIESATKPEENASLDDIDFVGSDAYYNIDNTNPNYAIDLDATLIKIKEKAKDKGIKTITFVDSIDKSPEIFNKSRYSLKVGSLFFVKNCANLANFILVTETGDAPSDTRVQVIRSVTKSVEDNSDSDKDDINFVGADAYYKIDKSYSNSTIIDLDATLAVIKERARAKNIKTITFVGIIKGHHEAYYKGNNSQVGSLYYLKNDERPMFILITGNIDYVNLPMHEDIDPVVIKKDDPEDKSDSKEDDIEAVKDEDDETVNISSDVVSSVYIIKRYANADTSELDPDVYTKIAFPIFMKPTATGTNVSFADICNLYDFDITETVKRIKNAAYLEKIKDVYYIDKFRSFDDIFKTEMAIRYGYRDGSLFLVRESTKNKQDPCFVILRKPKTWDDGSQFDAILYRINPVMRSAKIYSVKKIDVIDTYADGDIRIACGLKDLITIFYAQKIKEICDKRNYNFSSIINCLKGVTAIIGGGMCLTFEGTVDSLNSIVLVDPVVAYNTCSVFFVRDFIDGEEEPYFVIYMPITGKTKNGYNFRLYRIYPIPNLNQDPNTDSQDDSNAREIDQFTAICRANLEVSEADKVAYMTVEFSRIVHIYDDGEIHSLVSICKDWKFKFYDTIKRIRLVAYMNDFKKISFAGTVCSHEEILEKEVLYSNGSLLFVSDEEDPHFVIVEVVDGSTCLNRINPVKE